MGGINDHSVEVFERPGPLWLSTYTFLKQAEHAELALGFIGQVVVIGLALVTRASDVSASGPD